MSAPRRAATAVVVMVMLMTSIGGPLVTAQDSPAATPVAEETESPTVVATETAAPTEAETPAATESFVPTEVSTPEQEEADATNTSSVSRNSMAIQAEPSMLTVVTPGSFENLPSNGTVTVVARIQLPEGHSFVNGSIYWATDNSVAYSSFNFIIEDYATNEFDIEIGFPIDAAFIDDCSDGGVNLDVRTRLWRQGDESFTSLDSDIADVPCSFASDNTVISPVITQPVVAAHCGPGNDEVIPAETQPLGVNPVPVVSEWENGTITLTYSPASGYAFAEGYNPVITVTDDNNECVDPTLVLNVDSTTFTNLNRSEDIFWTGTLTLPEGHSYVVDLEKSHPLLVDGIEGYAFMEGGPNVYTVKYWIYPGDTFTEYCTDNNRLILEASVTLPEGDGERTIHADNLTVPCTFADQNLTLVTPTHEVNHIEVCEADSMQINDIITLVPQEGVEVLNESWGNGEFLIDIGPAEGYIFSSGDPVEFIRVRDTSTICDPASLEIDETSTVLEGVNPGDQISISATLTVPPHNPYDVADVELLPGVGSGGSLQPTVSLGTGETIPLSFPYTVPENFADVCSANQGTMPITVNALLTGPTIADGILETSASLPCSPGLPIVIPDLNAIVQTTVCGDQNDTFITTQENVEISEVVWSGDSARIYLVPADGYQFPQDAVADLTKMEIVIEDCTPVTADLGAIVQTAVCGDANDTFATSQENVEVSTIEWNGNTATVSLSAADSYYFPIDAQSEFEFVDDGPCAVTPLLPAFEEAVCGPDNDVISVPDQPEGVILEDTGWIDNERTISWNPAEGFAFPENTPANFVSTDENVPCEVEPVGKQLTVILNTSDGGSIPGTPYQVFAPSASMAQIAPFAEGVVDANNQIVLQGLMPGDYRLVVAPEGYEPIDTTVTVTDDGDPQEITIDVAAIQIAPTPTVEPTTVPTVEPTVTPTTEPTVAPTNVPTEIAPTQAPADTAVTGLPQTGSGPSSSSMIIGLSGLLAAAIVAMAIGSRRLKS